MLLTLVALLAFAGNSLLCRLALKSTSIDPASFTTLRIVAGALVLALILLLRRSRLQGSWPTALALFAYAAAFSFAYVSLSAAIGALLLFGAVQVTMLGYGLARGERLYGLRLTGFLLATVGLVALLLPGLQRPPLAGALLMLSAGAAWGVYSLRGKGAVDPVAATAGNFIRAVLPTLLLSAVMWRGTSMDAAGAAYAVLSGALTSGIGYVVWYAALRGLHATEAATVQLAVPVIAALGGVLLLSEPLTPRLVLCGLAILCGIALVIRRPPEPAAA
jgi:drug/metabolite transporter (DMT)-like permease